MSSDKLVSALLDSITGFGQSMMKPFELQVLSAKAKEELPFFLLVISILILERILTKQKTSLGLIRTKDRSSLFDLFCAFLYVFNIRRFFSNLIFFGLVGYLASWKQNFHFEILQGTPFLLRFAMAFLLYDFLIYWSHRLKHEIPLLWHTHELHHSSENLNVFTSYRVHPLDFLFSAIVVYFPIEILFREITEIFWFALLTSGLGFINHSRIDTNYGWLGRWVFISPRFHFLHHSKDLNHRNKNYGKSLVIWDRLFGTYIEAATPVHAIEVGIEGVNNDKTGFMNLLITPVINFYSELFCLLRISRSKDPKKV